MFKCDLCSATSQPGQKCQKVIMATRKVEYPKRTKVNAGYKDKGTSKVRSRSKSDRQDDPGGEGWEIESEVSVIGCEECTGNSQPCPGTYKGRSSNSGMDATITL